MIMLTLLVILRGLRCVSFEVFVVRIESAVTDVDLYVALYAA